MKAISTGILFLLIVGFGKAQTINFDTDRSISNLYIKMYGEIQYYQPVNLDQYAVGKFDAKRLVALFGYQFNKNTQFITEWELEHANEMFVEQAFIKHKLRRNTNLKAGMILIPMGLVNENHEPTQFSSVERPIIDKLLVPTTWRDIGIGLQGIWTNTSIKYQAYLVNGLVGFKNDTGLFRSTDTYRGGRQKGIKTIMSGLPAFSGQLEYFGLQQTKIGLSVYSGFSNTDAYNGLDRKDVESIASADSTRIYSTMIGLHMTTSWKRLNVKLQAIVSVNNNTDAYNQRTGKDLGKVQSGAYIELNRPVTKNNKLVLFSRYSYFLPELGETEQSNSEFVQHHYWTNGMYYTLAKGAMLKLDLQWRDFQNRDEDLMTINTGIGVWF